MPGTTPVYGLPYPTAGDPIAQGAAAVQALAEAAEVAIATGGGGGGGGMVTSVNGQTGTVELDAADVAARPDTWTPAWSDVSDKPATFPPTTGTTAATAKPGNWTPAWSDVSGKPATFPPTIGTTSTTAKAGNYTPAWSEVTGKPATFPPDTHTHTTAQITASGTPSSSTYLRGDGTWSTPPSGGGGGAVDSVNGKTGTVNLTATDVGARPNTWTPAWSDVTGKPATFPPTTGTTAATAKPGNWTPAWSEVTGKPTIPAAPVVTTTVGTAVHLDGYLIHGDTGRRDITGLLSTAPTAGQLYIRRIVNVLQIWTDPYLSFSGTVTGVTITLPVGWRAVGGGTGHHVSASNNGTLTATATGFVLDYGMTATHFSAISGTFLCAESWPTATVGTAA